MFSHISDIVRELQQEITQPKEKFKFPFETINHAFAGKDGVEYNSIITITGLPGVGKSTLVEQIKSTALKNQVAVYAIELEMPPKAQLLRRLKYELNKEEITVDDLNQVDTTAPYFIFSEALLASELIALLKTRITDPKRKYLVTIDSAPLINGFNDKDRLDSLYKQLVNFNLYLNNRGIKALFIVLTHLNRECVKPERLMFKTTHYPTQSDILNSAAPYNFSDIVLAIHKPADFLPPNHLYGIDDFVIRDEDGNPHLFVHVLKNRQGIPNTVHKLTVNNSGFIVEHTDNQSS